MAPTAHLPLAVGVLALVPFALRGYSRRLHRLLIRLALLLFGGMATDVPSRRLQKRKRSLRAAHVPTTYRQYAAESALLSVVLGYLGGIAGFYVVWAFFWVLALDPGTANDYLPEAFEFLSFYMGRSFPPATTVAAYNVGVGLLFGVFAAAATLSYRWYYPNYVADERARQIDISLPMTVSFFYALSRSGMSFPKAMRILAENDHVYGHAAEEVAVAVRNVDVFGMDVVTAVQTMARRSPSSKFREFSENLSSVLQTGGSLSEFLHRQYQDYRQEAEAQQERLLELVETLAEAYVTVFVAGPLFLITILVIIGITVGDALPILRVFVYLILPLGNIGFIIYLSTVVDNLSRRDPTEEEISIAMHPRGVRRRTDLTEERGLGPDDPAEAAVPRTLAAVTGGDADPPGDGRPDGGRTDGGHTDGGGPDGGRTDGGRTDDGRPDGERTDPGTDGGDAGDRPGTETVGGQWGAPDEGDGDGSGSGAGHRREDRATARRDSANLERLAAYKQFREVQRRLGSPVRTVIRRPTSLLWVTFPVAVFLIGIRIPSLLADGVIGVAEFDDLLIQSLLFLTGTFALAYEVHRRRVEAIESQIPDFLDRMASLNEAGMTVVESLDRIRRTELGALDDEIEVLWQDITWGADVETALKRFESRVRTKTVSRIVTLTTEAMKASGNLGTVLRIAADQAKDDRRLKRKRRQEMFTYLAVVYISVLVFLIIIGILNEVLIPSLPDAASLPNATATGGGEVSPVPAISNLGSVDEAAYQQLFLHTAVIQGSFSGLIAGQLSAGDARNGAKHVTILVALGYVTFLLLV